ncbi:hypothetical protein BGZ81_009767 [Podila clonocystis]|nr:hypothetical protein BGZ81_009767 [Podila clonocystis]
MKADFNTLTVATLASMVMSDNGVTQGSVETLASTVKVGGHTVSFTIAPVPLTILPTAHDAFAALAKTVITSESWKLVLSGTVDTTVNLGVFLGKKTLSGIGFESRNIFTGLNGLPDIKFVILIENTPDAACKKQIISFKVKVNTNSKSNVSVKTGDVVFNAAAPLAYRHHDL